MDAVSGMQQKILRYIQRTLDERGVAPSVREIGDAVGLSSTSSVQYNLNKLERMGCIERDPNCKRTIRLPGRAAQVAQVPLLGTVTAGVPILATQHIEDGDIVVVERTPVAENGQIVVAMIDEEATVKRFYKEHGHFRLQPENDAYAPIIVDELVVLGRVKFVIRQYY